MHHQLQNQEFRSKLSYRKLALASVAIAPLYIGLAAVPAHAQIVNTATVTGTPDSGTLDPVEAMESVTVAVPIIAANDSVNNINGTLGQTGVLNVLGGDTLDSNPAATGTVTITEVTPAAPLNPGDPVPTLNTATGEIDVPPGTPAGTYQIEYQICETANPNNCDTAIAEIEVVLSEINADPDAVTGINGATGQDDVLDVLDGDELNNNPATLADVDITVLTPADPNEPGDLVPVLDPATGTVDVPAGTPAGTYEIVYQICETADPDNCSQNTATITVEASDIVATDDTVTGVNGATGADDVLNVFGDDTVNGVGADATNSILSVPATDAGGNPNSVPPELEFDPADGSINVKPGTPAGTYSFTYEICEALNPTNCKTAVATVVVEASEVVATDDSTTVPAADATAGADDVLNVFDDDTVNGDTASTGNANLSVPAQDADGNPNSVPSELVFNPADGTIDVAPGTVAGDYSFTYQICETLNPTNCKLAVATVTVAAAPSLQMVKEAVGDPELVVVGQEITYTYTVTNNGNVTIRGVAVTDSHNAAGAAPTPTNPQLVTDNGPVGDSTDGNSSDDQWDVLAPGDVIRFTGTYTVQQADIDNLQ